MAAPRDTPDLRLELPGELLGELQEEHSGGVRGLARALSPRDRLRGAHSGLAGPGAGAFSSISRRRRRGLGEQIEEVQGRLELPSSETPSSSASEVAEGLRRSRPPVRDLRVPRRRPSLLRQRRRGGAGRLPLVLSGRVLAQDPWPAVPRPPPASTETLESSAGLSAGDAAAWVRCGRSRARRRRPGGALPGCPGAGTVGGTGL